MTANEIEIFTRFKIHADAFERNQVSRQDSKAVPTFPIDFEEMINKEMMDHAH